MRDAAAVESLFSGDVLEERDGDVVLSNSFEASIADYEGTVAELPREELSDLVRGSVDEGTPIEPLARLGEDDPRVVAELLALDDHLEPSADTNWTPFLPVLRLFRPDLGPTEGVPDSFVPIPGDQLPAFARLYSRLFVYVWLDDCEPCDALKPRLESLFERPRDVMSFAVYGPDHKEALAREYDVTAGPAMLFLRDGEVDTRLYGAHDESIIETELDTLRER